MCGWLGWAGWGWMRRRAWASRSSCSCCLRRRCSSVTSAWARETHPSAVCTLGGSVPSGGQIDIGSEDGMPSPTSRFSSMRSWPRWSVFLISVTGSRPLGRHEQLRDLALEPVLGDDRVHELGGGVDDRCVDGDVVGLAGLHELGHVGRHEPVECTLGGGDPVGRVLLAALPCDGWVLGGLELAVRAWPPRSSPSLPSAANSSGAWWPAAHGARPRGRGRPGPVAEPAGLGLRVGHGLLELGPLFGDVRRLSSSVSSCCASGSRPKTHAAWSRFRAASASTSSASVRAWASAGSSAVSSGRSGSDRVVIRSSCCWRRRAGRRPAVQVRPRAHGRTSAPPHGAVSSRGERCSAPPLRNSG